jgi:hypothetical protein
MQKNKFIRKLNISGVFKDAGLMAKDSLNIIYNSKNIHGV